MTLWGGRRGAGVLILEGECLGGRDRTHSSKTERHRKVKFDMRPPIHMCYCRMGSKFHNDTCGGVRGAEAVILEDVRLGGRDKHFSPKLVAHTEVKFGCDLFYR